MSGYWDNPEASARGRCATDGSGPGTWARCDRDGFLTLKDRSKDLIVSGGSNIYPREVEEVLLLHPAVAEASVVGRPDPSGAKRWWRSSSPRRRRAAHRSARRALPRATSRRFKRPKEYRFVDRLPKNNYGKVCEDRAACHGRCGALLAAPANLPYPDSAEHQRERRSIHAPSVGTGSAATAIPGPPWSTDGAVGCEVIRRPARRR
jgi:acyl-CoA synthetase (AMP-forming)/AMP-acid ligase II